jgi:TIR domain
VAIKVFVTYSHKDADLLGEDSLLGFLKGLEREGVEFWWDERLVIGDEWDDEIKRRIRETDIALALVSQWFLDSSYCTNIEISRFLEECRSRGLVVFPIIVSACEWERHKWLKTRQFLPGGRKTVRKDFADRGSQEELFLRVRQDLRKQIERIHASRTTVDAFQSLTSMSHDIVKNVNSLLGEFEAKKEVTDALLGLLKEFSDTHSKLVQCVDPLVTLTRDAKHFESDFLKSYRTYRIFRYEDSLREAKTKCSEVPFLLQRLKSNMPRFTNPPTAFESLEKAFEELADYDRVIVNWERIFDLVDRYCENANFYLSAGHISEAISVMDNFKTSIDKSYRESLKALRNMNDLIVRIRAMYS